MGQDQLWFIKKLLEHLQNNQKKKKSQIFVAIKWMTYKHYLLTNLQQKYKNITPILQQRALNQIKTISAETGIPPPLLKTHPQVITYAFFLKYSEMGMPPSPPHHLKPIPRQASPYNVVEWEKILTMCAMTWVFPFHLG